MNQFYLTKLKSKIYYMASKIAHGISLITNKSIVGIILTLVIICSTYFHDSNADISSLTLSLWSRLELDKNSIFWENALGLLGLFVTAILMYIILQYNFFLDVLVTDYAISIFTLVFSIIYYYEINYDARPVFAVFCITIPPLSLAPTSVWPYGITCLPSYLLY